MSQLKVLRSKRIRRIEEIKQGRWWHGLKGTSRVWAVLSSSIGRMYTFRLATTCSVIGISCIKVFPEQTKCYECKCLVIHKSIASKPLIAIMFLQKNAADASIPYSYSYSFPFILTSRAVLLYILRPRQGMLLEIPQQRLVKYQHGPRLYTCPDRTRSNASKPSSNSFCFVYYLQAGHNR